MNFSYIRLSRPYPTFCPAFPESMTTVAECRLRAMPTYLLTAPNSYLMEGTWTWNLKTFPAYRGSSISRYWAKTYQKSADSQLLINVRVSIRQCSLMHRRIPLGPETSPHCVTPQFIPLLTALDLPHLSLPTRSVCAGTMQGHSTGRWHSSIAWGSTTAYERKQWSTRPLDTLGGRRKWTENSENSPSTITKEKTGQMSMREELTAKP